MTGRVKPLVLTLRKDSRWQHILSDFLPPVSSSCTCVQAPPRSPGRPVSMLTATRFRPGPWPGWGRCASATALDGGTALVWDLAAAMRRPPPAREPDAAELAGWWADLAADDGGRAYAAVWRLVEESEAAVVFLRARLRLPPAAEVKAVRRLVLEKLSQGRCPATRCVPCARWRYWNTRARMGAGC